MTLPETDIAVLKEQVAEIIRDSEKRERLLDARHEAVMAQLGQLQLTIASGRSFAAGATTTLKVQWGLLGGLLAYIGSWAIEGWKG